MLVRFFFMLRAAAVPVSIPEFLAFLDALRAKLSEFSIDQFYYLARMSLVKDESHYDRFDQVFSAHFDGAELAFAGVTGDVPEEWLRRQAELYLSEEEREKIKALGGFEKLMEALRERLDAQRKRHEGGSKNIGTAGTSPFGAYGYHPEGIRIGQDKGRMGRAVKVWDRREYRNLSSDVTLGTRNIKVALRSLRRFAREGVADQLDLDGTIDGTAKNGGLLDLKLVPERHNAVKILLFLDVGGSMDEHVRTCTELFSASRSEFKHLEYYYFHNFIYESVWRDNSRRRDQRVPTEEIVRKFGPDYKLIFVGDAAMSPYEIAYPGGSVEHWNEEAGEVWLRRLLKGYPHSVWLNPVSESRWGHSQSNALVRELMSERMYPLTLAGLGQAIKSLKSERVISP